jgi:DNA-directed RNA polymerase specialized sigma subunit
MHVFPYRDSYRENILWGIALDIDFWATFQTWGPALRNAYLKHSELSYYIRRVEAEGAAVWANEPLHTPPKQIPETSQALTEQQRQLVLSHLPLVAARANRYAPIKRHTFVRRKSGRVVGRPITHVADELNIHLQEIGQRCLEDCARKYDPALRVTFGAFADSRVTGAMVNYLQREKLRTVRAPIPDYAPKDNKPWNDKPVKRHRNSTGGYREGQYASTNKVGRSRLMPATMGGALEAALQTLNQQQRVVYRGRVLAHPQVTRAELARQLRIKDESRIRKIELKAIAKVAQALRSQIDTPQ